MWVSEATVRRIAAAMLQRYEGKTPSVRELVSAILDEVTQDELLAAARSGMTQVPKERTH